MRNSLEALGNLLYLAKMTGPPNADTSIRFLDMAEDEFAALIVNLKVALVDCAPNRPSVCPEGFSASNEKRLVFSPGINARTILAAHPFAAPAGNV